MVFRLQIRSILAQRKLEKGNYNDYLQLMINAQNKKDDTEENDMEDERSDILFGQTKDTYTGKTQIDVTEDDILANTFLFFLAGYETTSSLLSHLFYSLALNEKCQQKLYEEIKQFNGEFNYESITKMPYLEACVAETLRMYPPIGATIRMSSQEYTIGLLQTIII